MKPLKYLARVKALTAEQRERLATQLGQAAGGASAQRLMAYVVPREGAAVSEDELRAFLGQQLPEYMCPAGFVLLESLPLLPNGKIDRTALASLARTQRSAKPDFVAPRNETEAKLASIWGAVLGAEKVGVLDNFFQLGGHSLLALQVMAHLREAFQTEVPLRRLFETPTVAGLAEAVEQSRQGLLGGPIRRIARPTDVPALESGEPADSPRTADAGVIAVGGRTRD